MNTIKFLINCGIVLLVTVTGLGQVSPDSISSLKQRKQSLELKSKINEQKLQLAKLENNIDKNTREMENTAAEAQKAADENAEAATRLSNNPQDKKLARRTEKAADYAKKSARRARAAADNLANLIKDIESLKSKIADEEAKLASIPEQNN
jgi:chromosome segregation ATPase